jgi:hypothetical protein
MKSTVLRLTALFLILSGGLFSCKKEISKEELLNYEPPIVEYSLECGIIEINNEEYIKMCAVPQRVPINSYFKVIIENHSEEDFDWGLPYCFEYFNETIWEPVEFNGIFPLIDFILKPGQIDEQSIFLSDKFILKPGKYRVIKHFLGCTNNLYAEFEVIDNQ